LRLATIGKLRIFVSVPQAYAQAARPGTPTTITLEENPGKVYRGTLARTSNALDPSARTMLSEVEMENRAAKSCRVPTWWCACAWASRPAA
jgi:multidrug efflux pump subunit AcrA (membrane-fusion protein)